MDPFHQLGSSYCLVETAIERSRRSANPDWYLTAVQLARHVAATNDFFTTDDVWAALADHAQVWEKPPEPRAMGAVMRSLALDRLATRTSRVRPTVRPCAHHRPVSIWRSLRAV